jgi:hypothetical protein
MRVEADLSQVVGKVARRTAEDLATQRGIGGEIAQEMMGRKERGPIDAIAYPE